MAHESTHPDRPQNLVVMCVLAMAVGTIGGIGAWLFRLLIGLLHNVFFLGQVELAYDANVHSATNPWGVGIIVVPVIGGLAVVWLVKSFAPEAKGHGVPEVMDAIHYQGGRIRPVVAVVKSLASAICIGSGGSVGREGPIIQIGSAFGSTLGQIVRLPARQRITLIAAGAGAGIAATFNAPLGGILFAIELLLISVNVQNLLPVALATVTANYIGRALLGTHPAFDLAALRVTDFHLTSPWLLILFIPFGMLMGLVAVGFIKGIYWAEERFDAVSENEYLRHILGM
ncbi:MAG TPA: chloride channel protein, partial [Planctomycetaceae bacterium]|nr:chloride channel protein [Planctomycetaceae bacterium]